MSLKTYSISGDIAAGTLSSGKLDQEIAASGSVNSFAGVSREGDSFHILGDTFSDETALDTLVSNHVAISLDDYKAIKNSAIDQRTGELIGQGASFGGSVFSLSDNAQRVWMGLKIAESVQTFPVKISTKDSQRFEIDDLTELDNFWLTIMGTVKAHYTSGGDLRDSVNLATDEAGVDAVVDNR